MSLIQSFKAINKTKPECLVFDHLARSENGQDWRLPERKYGCPTSRLFCEKWDYDAHSSFPIPRVTAHTKKNGPPEGDPFVFQAKS